MRGKFEKQSLTFILIEVTHSHLSWPWCVPSSVCRKSRLREHPPEYSTLLKNTKYNTQIFKEPFIFLFYCKNMVKTILNVKWLFIMKPQHIYDPRLHKRS